MTVYPFGKFVDCSFNRFGFIVRTNRHTDRHTQTPLNASLPRLSSTSVMKMLFVASVERSSFQRLKLVNVLDIVFQLAFTKMDKRNDVINDLIN